MATYAPNQLHQVPLAELQPDPTQPRKYMDPVVLEELTASVSQNGIIQPVVCRQDLQTGLVYVVAGERRCAAARKAGLATVPAVFIEGANYAEIALVENLLRQDLNPVEEAEAIVNSIAMTASKIGDLEFPNFSEEDRAMMIETMTSMKETLDEAIPRAVENRGKPM